MTSRGSGAALLIQALRSWCSMLVDATACTQARQDWHFLSERVQGRIPFAIVLIR